MNTLVTLFAVIMIGGLVVALVRFAKAKIHEKHSQTREEKLETEESAMWSIFLQHSTSYQAAIDKSKVRPADSLSTTQGPVCYFEVDVKTYIAYFREFPIDGHLTKHLSVECNDVEVREAQYFGPHGHFKVLNEDWHKKLVKHILAKERICL